MKNYISILILFFFATNTFAQDGPMTSEFTVNGIKVIHKKSIKQVVSVKLFIEGGVSNYGEKHQGIEGLTLRLMAEGGTKNFTKDKMNGILEKYGTSISSHLNYDYSTFDLRCLKPSWDQSWEVYADAICNPNFDEAELVNIKDQMVAAVQQGESDPDTHLRNTAMKNTFKTGHYSRVAEGTVESIENINIDDVKAFYKNTIARNNKVFLVVVGDISKADLEKKVSSLTCFSKEAGTIAEVTDFNISESAFMAEEREIATNYVRGLMNAPKLGTADEIPMRVAMSILGDRMWTEIRTKRNLSYAPSAFFPSGVLNYPYTALYVSTDKPNEAVQVMIDEINKIREVGFDEEELINKKGSFLTRYYMGLETNSSQAETLGKAELAYGWNKADKFMKMVDQITLDQINTVFNKYITAINWTYLGDGSIVDKSIFLSPIVK